MILTKRQKKTVKKLAVKYLMKETPEREPEGVLLHGWEADDWGSERHIFLVDAISGKEALKKLEDEYPVNGITLTPSAYDCTGRAFCSPATVKQITDNRQLVRLEVKYDV